MRELGLPKLLTWRWTPFAGLVLGSLSFVGFAMLAIPDHIGHPEGESSSTSLNLGNAFARAQAGAATPASNLSGDDGNSAAGTVTPTPIARAAANIPNLFPKRGFTPPLERAEAPAAAPAPPAPAPPPPPPPPAAVEPPPAPAPAPAPQPEAPPSPDPAAAPAPDPNAPAAAPPTSQ